MHLNIRRSFFNRFESSGVFMFLSVVTLKIYSSISCMSIMSAWENCFQKYSITRSFIQSEITNVLFYKEYFFACKIVLLLFLIQKSSNKRIY